MSEDPTDDADPDQGPGDTDAGEDRGGSDVDQERAGRLEEKEQRLDEREARLDRREAELEDEEEELLDRREQTVTLREEIEERESAIENREASLDDREASIAERERALDEREAELDRRAETLDRYVGDKLEGAEDRLADTVRSAVHDAASDLEVGDRAGGRFGAIGGTLLALVGITLVVGGVVNVFAMEVETVPQLLASDFGNLSASAVLLFCGLAANLAAAAGRP